MTKEDFLKKHNLNETDYRNLKRFEELRQSGVYNMYEYFGLMIRNNLNGGERMVEFIKKDNNYGDFLESTK